MILICIMLYWWLMMYLLDICWYLLYALIIVAYINDWCIICYSNNLMNKLLFVNNVDMMLSFKLGYNLNGGPRSVEYTIKLHSWQCIWLLCTFNYMYFVMKCGMIAALSRVYMVGNILATSYETEQSVRMVSCVPNTELYKQIDSWASIIAAYDSAP